MSASSETTRRPRLALGLILAAVLSCVPPIAVLVSRLSTPGLPARLPSHWNFSGKLDSWSSLQSSFWFSLLPGLVGALLVTLIVVLGGNDMPRAKAGLGIAAISFVAAGITFTWFVFLAVAADPHHTARAFGVMVLAALVLAVLIFVASILRSRPPLDDVTEIDSTSDSDVGTEA